VHIEVEYRREFDKMIIDLDKVNKVGLKSMIEITYE
jgi:hypothetical protein